MQYFMLLHKYLGSASAIEQHIGRLEVTVNGVSPVPKTNEKRKEVQKGMVRQWVKRTLST